MTEVIGERAIEAVVSAALELVTPGTRIGLGSGHAAATFIGRLGDRVRAGLSIVAVPTSDQSARCARAAGIPLIDLEEDDLDLTIDGADEVAANLDLMKGRGGALVRERIVASASKRQVILVGHDKLVRALGERGPIAVEVIPLARGPAMRRLSALGVRPETRMAARGQPFVTDNQNWIVDCVIDEPLADARAARVLESAMLAIPGVVDTGLFLGTAERVLVGYPDGRVEVLMSGDR